MSYSKRFFGCLGFAALLLCALASARASASTLTVSPAEGSYALAPHFEFLEDATGALRVEDLAKPKNADRFRPVPAGGEANFGYSRSAYWLRLSLGAGEAETEWLLEIAFPSLDLVEVYAPGPDGHFDRQSAGDLRPFAERPTANRNFVFPLRVAPGKGRTYYLRIVSQGSLSVPARLWERETFRSYNQGAYAVLSLYYGMLLALGLYNLLLFVSLRDRNYVAYVAFVTAMAVGQLSLNGLGNQYVWPDFPAWGNVALPSGFAATGFFGAVFTRLFLGTAQGAPGLDRAIRLLAGGFAAAALAPAVVPYQWAAILTSLLGVSFSAVAVFGGVLCLLRGQPGARYFLVAWTLLLIGVAVMGLRNLGWLPTTFLTSYAMQIGSALEMLLLSFALADRIHAIRREKDQAQAEALRIKHAMVQALQRSEQELERRVAERTHELEAANEKLRESERQLQFMAHRDPLTGLANRIVLEDRLDHALAQAQRTRRPVAVLMVDLDGFKAVNDEHGHAAGDELLVTLAARLTGCVRESDTVARIGGDEFVIVLDTLQDADAADQVAAKLIAELSRPVSLGRRALQLSASVGIVSYPRDGTTTQILLRQADRAMYAAKHAGRGCYRRADVPIDAGAVAD